jgi:hypothetical protein
MPLECPTIQKPDSRQELPMNNRSVTLPKPRQWGVEPPFLICSIRITQFSQGPRPWSERRPAAPRKSALP